VDPGAGNGHDRALLMATSARFHWPSPRGFVSAYAQNLMAADTRSAPWTLAQACRVRAELRRGPCVPAGATPGHSLLRPRPLLRLPPGARSWALACMRGRSGRRVVDAAQGRARWDTPAEEHGFTCYAASTAERRIAAIVPKRTTARRASLPATLDETKVTSLLTAGLQALTIRGAKHQARVSVGVVEWTGD